MRCRPRRLSQKSLRTCRNLAGFQDFALLHRLLVVIVFVFVFVSFAVMAVFVASVA